MKNFKQPIDNIEWVERDMLTPNNYNPNKMTKYDFELLVISILEDGWTQPVIRNQNNEIVDGYHRWLASNDKRIRERDKGRVPVTTTNPTDKVSQQMSTIRHNRAKGTHGVFKMSKIVGDMIKDEVPVQEIMRRLQMEEEEVVKLGISEGIPTEKIFESHKFSKAWGSDDRRK